MVIKIEKFDHNTKKLAEIELITKVEAVLYLKGRPLSKKDLSETTSSEINAINNVLKELKNKSI